jgi:hypothetical protein
MAAPHVQKEIGDDAIACSGRNSRKKNAEVYESFR